MTDEQLRKGNDLKQELNQEENSLESLRHVLKRIDLDNGLYTPKHIQIKIDGITATLSKDSASKFLWEQLKEVEQNIKELETQFKSI